MSASEIVTGILSALVGVGLLVMLPRVWHGWFTRRETSFRGRRRTHGDLATIALPFSDRTRRGLARGFVPMALAWCGAVIGYWVAALETGADIHHPVHAARVAAVAAAAWFLLGLLLLLTIAYFNWPKFMVPPPQRTEPGAFAEWRTSSRHRRRGALSMGPRSGAQMPFGK